MKIIKIILILVVILPIGCQKTESDIIQDYIDIGLWNMKTEKTKVLEWQLKPGYQIASISATIMDDADFGWSVFPAKNITYFSGEIYLTVPGEYNLNLYSDTLKNRGVIHVTMIKFND